MKCNTHNRKMMKVGVICCPGVPPGPSECSDIYVCIDCVGELLKVLGGEGMKRFMQPPEDDEEEWPDDDDDDFDEYDEDDW